MINLIYSYYIFEFIFNAPSRKWSRLRRDVHMFTVIVSSTFSRYSASDRNVE